MTVMLQILALLIVTAALIRGFRKGMVKQTSAVLGFAFGVVSSQVLRGGMEDWFAGVLPMGDDAWNAVFVCGIATSCVIYGIVFFGFDLFSRPLRFLLKPFGTGALNSILGAAFNAVQWFMIMSLFCNVILCLNPDSPLLDKVASDDGNIMEITLLFAPALLGGEDASELAHRRQLREAGKISKANFMLKNNVIIDDRAFCARSSCYIKYNA